MSGDVLGNYGLVRITAGKHKGKVGYYDNEGERGKAIVYLEEPATFRRLRKHRVPLPRTNRDHVAEHRAFQTRTSWSREGSRH